MPNQKRIDELEETPLTGNQVLYICGNKAKIVKSSDLYRFDSIEELLYPYGAICLLYMTSPDYGHWTALFQQDDDTIEFFDSYGYAPDAQLKKINKKFRDANGMAHPLLKYLLINCNYKVVYNKKKLQRKNKKTSTCGYFVGSRIAYRDMSLSQYINMLKSIDKDLDEAVIQLTTNE
jgi:hypothetical protein